MLDKQSQHGYMQLTGFGTVLIVLGIVCGVVGWAVIESIIWLFSNINISWVG